MWSHCVITLYKMGMDIRTTLNAGKVDSTTNVDPTTIDLTTNDSISLSPYFITPHTTHHTPRVHHLRTTHHSPLTTRTTNVLVIYRKALGLSNEARQSSTTGEVVNLMSADSEKIPMACITMHSTWVVPMFLTVAIWLLTGLVSS